MALPPLRQIGISRLMAVTSLAALALAWAATPARAEALVLKIDRPTALGFLRAAMPHTIEVGAAGMTQRFRLSNPRDLVFEQGKVRLTLDCTGSPIPFDGQVQPTLAITFDPKRGAWVVRAESLPVTLTGLGTVRLDQFVEPFVLPVTVSRALDSGVPGMIVRLAIRGLEILPDRIELRGDMAFSPPDPAPGTRADRLTPAASSR